MMLEDPIWIQIAKRELGVKEIPGDKSNPRIELYHSVTRAGAAEDDVPWCSSFACWVMAQASLPHPASKSASKWLTYGEPTSPDRVGAVLVFKRHPRGWHVAFSLGVESHLAIVIGGNQGNSVSIATRPAGDVIAARWPHLP